MRTTRRHDKLTDCSLTPEVSQPDKSHYIRPGTSTQEKIMEVFKMRICGKDYPIIGTVTTKEFGAIPLVDLPMMDDRRWDELCLESRLKHPENYEGIEGVAATVAMLRARLGKTAEVPA